MGGNRWQVAGGRGQEAGGVANLQGKPGENNSLKVLDKTALAGKLSAK